MRKAPPTSGLSMPAQQRPSLLATKLYIPPARPMQSLVSRPRLIERLDRDLASRLILVSGPAGFGKTTLLSEWLTTCECLAAWVSLDAADNDQVRFLSYLIAALQTIVPGAGEAANGLLHSPQSPPIESILTLLVNDLCSLPDKSGSQSRPYVLVLDDYHVIDASTVHSAVVFLLDNLPPDMHLIIATRVDPPLPLARWRSRGQLVEIRADDLRFTPDETTAFLNQVMGLNLSAEDIVTLETRTEGWIAGLQMAALAMKPLTMRGQPAERVSHFIQAFSGSHHYILDYLSEEILNRQPESVQAFLLRTSILERLTGDLCDAVMGQAGGQAMLEMLERANLFVVPLDDEWRWYRYHHLFADLLRARLQQSQPEIVGILHARAAEWYERHGLIAEAVSHALAARDFERAARLVEQSVVSLFAHGEFTTILTWINALPEELARSRPWLCIHHAWVLMYGGQLTDVEPLLQSAEQQTGSMSNNPTPETQDMLGNIAITRANLAEMYGDVPRTIELARLAKEYVSQNNLASGFVDMVLGRAYLTSGDLTRAYLAFSDAQKLCQTTGNVYGTVWVLCYLARLRKIQGQLHQAADLYRQALRLATEQGDEFRLTGRIDIGMGDLACEWNNLESAKRHVLDGIEHNQRWGSPNALAIGYTVLARVLQAQGNVGSALDALQKAEELGQRHRIFPETSGLIENYRVRLWLIQGNLTAAVQWIASRPDQRGDGDAINLIRELEHITQTRVLIAQGKLDEAATLLTRLAESAEAGGRMGRLIEILVLQALALSQSHDTRPTPGRTAHALTVLRKCLLLAEPEGYVRVFVDEGAQMAALLRQAATHDIAPGYVCKLLAAFETTIADTMADDSSRDAFLRPRQGALVEPLSDRELEVLRLMADGLSNQEMAEQLTVVVGTIKTHVHNIYGKLNASSRTRAVARARELGLL